VTGLPLAARCALAAYPGWWRERYREDQERFLEDLVHDGRPLRRAVVNLAAGAVRVRLRPAGMPQTVGAWRDRTRASIAWATVPALAVLLLTVAIEQHSFRYSMWAGPHTALSPGGRVAADAMTGIQWASVVILLLLLTGWGLVGRLADRAPRGRAGRRWLLLTTAPLAAGVVEIGLNLLRIRLMPTVTVIGGLASGSTTVAHGGHPLAASVVSVAWDVVGVAGLLSIFCVVLAARNADLHVSDLRGGVWLAQLTAIVLFIVAVAVIAWGIGVTHQPPIPRADLIGSGPGIHPWISMQTSIAAEWPLISACLVAISIVTAWAALSARRSYTAARELLLIDA
jgi:hypothetical protein